MFTGVFALLERSLRTDLRDRWSHGFRVGTVIVGYGAMMIAAEQSRWFGAPGLRFFESLAWLNALLITLSGVGYFASVITEEKEEGTLGLMQMTGLSGLGILLGKFGSRLVQAALLVVLQIPFALLGITLGGVTLPQVAAVISALLSLLFLTANLALLVSVLSQNTRQAAFRMTLVVVGYCVLAWLVYEFMRTFAVPIGAGVRYPAFVYELNGLFVFTRLGVIMMSGAYPDLIGGHELANVAVGLLAFAASWLLFPWATRQPDHEPITRGWLGFRFLGRRWLSPGRVWEYALVWKDFHFLVGGWPRLAVKSAGYLLLMAAVWWYVVVWHGRPTYRDRDEAVMTNIVFLSFLLAWEGALLASRVFYDEVRNRTWSTLTLLPRTFDALCYTKVATSVVGLIPVSVLLSWLLFGTRTGLRNLEDILDEAMFWGLVGMFVTIAHLAALFSLYLRWGAVALAVGAVWLPFIGFLMLMSGGPGPDEDVVGAFMIVLSFFACLACHVLIGQRLRQLAAE